MPALAIGSLVMGVAQGYTAMQSQNAAARQYSAQGELLQAESNREAARIEDDGKRFAEEQKMMYIGSGVEIGGSAVVTLAQTDSWAKAEANAVRTRGAALRSYNEQAAQNAKNMGRAQFISGIAQGIGNAYSMYGATKGVSAAPGTMGTRSASDNTWNARTTGMKQMARF